MTPPRPDPRADPRQDPESDPRTPLAPLDLARGYADVAFSFHHRLPKLEAWQARTDRRLDSIGDRLDAIAEAVKARTAPAGRRHPSFSEEDDEITATGSHVKVRIDKIDRMQARLDEREAREREAEARARGAEEALEKQKKQAAEIEEYRERVAERRRRRWGFIILAGTTAFSILAWLIGWGMGHVTLEARTPTPHEFTHAP